MKIQSKTFRGPIHGSSSTANFRRIAQDSMTTSNLQEVVAKVATAQKKVDGAASTSNAKPVEQPKK